MTESETSDIGVISGYHIVQVLNRVIAKAANLYAPDLHFSPDYRTQTEYKMLLIQGRSRSIQVMLFARIQGSMQWCSSSAPTEEFAE